MLRRLSIPLLSDQKEARLVGEHQTGVTSDWRLSMSEQNDTGQGRHVQSQTAVTFPLDFPASTAEVALLSDSAGNLCVAVKAREGLSEAEAIDLTQLVTHLAAVTRLASDVQVLSPRGHRGPSDGLNDDGNPRLDQDLGGVVEADQDSPAARDRLFEPLDRVGIGVNLLAGVDDLPSHDGLIAHDASPSVGERGSSTVGDGQAAEGSVEPSAADAASLVVTPQLLRDVADWIRRRNNGRDTDTSRGLRGWAYDLEFEQADDERVEELAQILWRKIGPGEVDGWEIAHPTLREMYRRGVRSVLGYLELEQHPPQPRQWNDLRFVPGEVERVRSTDVDGRDHVFVRGRARHGWLWHDTGAPVSTMFMHSYAPYTEILGGAE
jgi:hypothetical protein